MFNIRSISFFKIEALKIIAGFTKASILDGLGWILPDGSFYGCERGELHADTAIRYIKQKAKEFGKALPTIRDEINMIKQLSGAWEYEKIYGHMAQSHGLIRVAHSSFDVPDTNSSTLSKISSWLKNNPPEEREIYIRIAGGERVDIEIDKSDLEEVDYDINRAIVRSKQKSRMMNRTFLTTV